MSAYVLDPIEYWQVRARSADHQRAALEARALLASTQAPLDAIMGTLAVKYHFPVQVPQFSLDDQTGTLTIPDGEGRS